jgi:hypothetical protein
MTHLAAGAAAVAQSVLTAFEPPPRTVPFRHWSLANVLPDTCAARLAGLEPPGEAVGDGGGRRETHNDRRVFLTPALQDADADCRDLAQALHAPRVVAALATRCGTCLNGTRLRIEYCRDHDGFWLEPHTDIGAKLFTLLIYLNTPPPAEDWGTDLYDTHGNLAGTAPSHANAGVAFVPGTDTWHGYRRRPITGVRRTLIVNYVVPDWRSVHELAFPGEVVSG